MAKVALIFEDVDDGAEQSVGVRIQRMDCKELMHRDDGELFLMDEKKATASEKVGMVYINTILTELRTQSSEVYQGSSKEVEEVVKRRKAEFEASKKKEAQDGSESKA